MSEHGDEAYKYRKIIDFASNINPYGPSKKAIKVIKKNLNKISQYPDSNSTKLKKAIANYCNVKPENVIVGNGSSEIIKLFCENLNNKKVLIPVPTFSLYEKYTKIFSGKVEYLFLKSENNFDYNFNEISDKIKKVNAVFLCSPNNPTGKSIKNEEILNIIEKNPKVYFFIDEAFIEFSDNESLCKYVENFENLFVLRSMTKFFSLAGLRVGYGIGNQKIIEKLKNIKVEWNVNMLAQIAAIESLNDKEYIENSKILIKKEKEKFFEELLNFELEIYPSDANFFLINLEKKKLKSKKLKKELLKYKILIRDCSNFKGLNDNYVRVCVNNRENNEKFIKAINEIFEKNA